MSVNKVILLGRLGKDVELKYTASGQPVANFSLAVTETWKDKGGQKQEKTEWVPIVVWGKLGELCNQYLGKGKQAYVEGKLETRSWDGKDGKKAYKTEVIASTVQFIEFAKKNDGPSPSGAGDNWEPKQYTEDDIPF